MIGNVLLGWCGSRWRGEAPYGRPRTGAVPSPQVGVARGRCHQEELLISGDRPLFAPLVGPFGYGEKPPVLFCFDHNVAIMINGRFRVAIRFHGLLLPGLPAGLGEIGLEFPFQPDVSFRPAVGFSHVKNVIPVVAALDGGCNILVILKRFSGAIFQQFVGDFIASFHGFLLAGFVYIR